MTELNERMRGVDHVPFRDDWDAVERRAASPQPMPDPTRGRGVRIVAVLVATFVVVGAALYGLSGLGSSTDGVGTGPASSDASYVNPMGIPITVDYPSDWYAQSVSQDSNPDPSVTGRPQIGLVVSNAPQAMPSPGDDSPSPGPLPDDPDLPSTFVTVTIIHVADPCGTSGDSCHPGLLTPNSPLPLSMSDAQIVPGDANIAILEATVSMHHLTITVQAGPRASASDLAAADTIVASIRPTKTEMASTTATPDANVARVTCGKDAVTLKDPIVQAREDGVHFVFDNQSNASAIDLHHESWDYGTAETVPLKDPVTASTSGIGPGRVTIACLPNNHSSYSDVGVLTADVTIVDAEGFYVPWDLSCGFGEQFRTQIDAPEDAAPTSVVSEVPGVLATDIFKRPNYPDSPRYTPTDFIVFREGRAVARTMGTYDSREGMWHLLVNACPGSGIEATRGA